MGNAAVSAAPAAAPAAAPTQDYSAQWAAYYRSIGKIGEAEAIEAQARLKQVNYTFLHFSTVCACLHVPGSFRSRWSDLDVDMLYVTLSECAGWSRSWSNRIGCSVRRLPRRWIWRKCCGSGRLLRWTTRWRTTSRWWSCLRLSRIWRLWTSSVWRTIAGNNKW